MNQEQFGARFKVAIRSSQGGGSRTFVLELDAEAAATANAGEVKQLLCKPPFNLCREASLLVLVLNGAILRDNDALLETPLSSLWGGGMHHGSHTRLTIINTDTIVLIITITITISELGRINHRLQSGAIGAAEHKMSNVNVLRQEAANLHERQKPCGIDPSHERFRQDSERNGQIRGCA